MPPPSGPLPQEGEWSGAWSAHHAGSGCKHFSKALLERRKGPATPITATQREITFLHPQLERKGKLELLTTGRGEPTPGMCVEVGMLFRVVGHSPKFTLPAPIPASSGYLGTPPTCSLICPAGSVGGSGPGPTTPHPTRHCTLSILSMSGPRLSQELTSCLFVCMWDTEIRAPHPTSTQLLNC